MNLFSSSKPSKPATPPSIDAARAKIDEMRRGAGLRGRAAAMLVDSKQKPDIAQRQVTGN